MFHDETSVSTRFASDRMTEIRKRSETAVAVRFVVVVIDVSTTEMAANGTKAPTVTAKTHKVRKSKISIVLTKRINGFDAFAR